MKQPSYTPHAPPWLRTAIAEIGIKEIPGSGNNDRILEYLATCENLGKWGKSHDSVPWCSAFVNWCFIQNGIRGTNHALARSWLTWGAELDEPRRGAVVVIQRKKPGADVATGSRAGFHVAFHDRMTRRFIQLIGGNQRNQVKVSRYPLDRYHIHGMFWPSRNITA